MNYKTYHTINAKWYLEELHLFVRGCIIFKKGIKARLLYCMLYGLCIQNIHLNQSFYCTMFGQLKANMGQNSKTHLMKQNSNNINHTLILHIWVLLGRFP